MEAAFFDLDKTIISRSSSFALGGPMYRAGLVSRAAVLRSAYAQLVFTLLGADERRMERAREALLRLTRGWDRAQVEEVVRAAIVDLIEPLVYQEALDLMAWHHAEGRDVYIVSTSPEEVVRPLAEHFGATGVVATRAEIRGGKYTGRLEFYCYGEGKAEAIREIAVRRGVDLAESFAYSDSMSDLPMLEAVGHPAAVNPSRDLRRVAEERGWELHDFRRSVQLRIRRPDATPSPAGFVAAGAAAVVVAGVVAWLYLRSRRGVGSD